MPWDQSYLLQKTRGQAAYTVYVFAPDLHRFFEMPKSLWMLKSSKILVFVVEEKTIVKVLNFSVNKGKWLQFR